MYFKKIEIHGFKSFAEPVVIEFDRGITCVVGPNGSGKSNICDAIRWVLGAQSAKMLRGDKMEDVIFAGTANRKSRGMAEVTLVIDNSTGLLPIDYNEVAITRRMYRSGESEYRINNNQCRMKDIRELIMDTGIGVEGYSIIGQGKISDIISNNTDSIREILEETAGIVMYRSKKAEAERKLDSATANMERVQDIIGEIEGRIDGLKEDSEKASEYLKLKELNKELEINITLKNIDNIELKNEYIKDDLINLSNQLNDNKEQRENLSKIISKINQKREEIDRLSEESREKQLEIIGEINSLSNSSHIDKERLSSILSNHERLENEIKILEEKINSEKENSKELFNNKKNVDEKLVELERDLEDKLDNYNNINGKIREKEESIDDKKNRLINIQSNINTKSGEVSSIINLKESLENRKALIIEEKDSGSDNNKILLEQIDTIEKETVGLKTQLEQQKEKGISLKEKYNEEVKKEKEISFDIENIKINLGQLSSRKKTFEEMESNYEGYNNGVKFIMKSQIQGINGVVAELIEVPKGYEIAIETALGGTMQNIICEKDQVAKTAINELKNSKSGRLTFMPLESIKPREIRRETSVANTEGFKGYAVDCINFDNKYSKAIEFLLGNVIVMDNMNNAVNLSKRVGRGFKIVTLEGEVVNAGGTITGGRYRNKSANILERRVEITRLDKEISQKKLSMEMKDSSLAGIKAKLEKYMENIKTNEEEVLYKEREKFAKENEITMVKASLITSQNSNDKWQKELDNIEKEQQGSEESIQGLEEQISELTLESERLEKLIEEEIESYKFEKEDAEKISEEITESKILLGACESEKNKYDEIVARVEKSLIGFEEEKMLKQESLKAEGIEKETILARSESSDKEIKEKEEKKTNIDTYLQELQQEKEEILKANERDLEEKETLEASINSIQNQKYELEIKQARFDAQLENAKNKLWEEFEVSYIQAMDFKKKEFVLSSAVKENREIRNRIKELGDVNVGAIKEYETVKERYDFLTSQKEDILVSMDELKQIIVDMDKIIRNKFKESFEQVVENFEAVFKELYGGGSAKIVLSDAENPFDSEIEITAQPPGKQLKHINLLSGGEKTMTAIALMFAVLRTKPTPCCILDEIEAALDDRNLDIFGNYIRSFEGVQFTLITHQKATMEHADVMYGITMPESGISKVYSLKMEEKLAEKKSAV